jgi:hypothetical protein
MSVELKDYSFEVKAEINDATIAWLETWANSIASHAKDNCQLDGDAGVQLRKSYKALIDKVEGKAQIGTDLESGYWEEFGTGEHAVREPHRRGWWVYIEGGSGYEGETNYYHSKEDAEYMAAYIRYKYGKKAVATNGRDPNYTLEKAFKAKKSKAITDLEKRLKGLDN